MNFCEKLGKERLFFDGGLGTILQEKGLKAGELPETWNITHPEEIISLHKSYLDAGSHVITTNTFGANALKYKENLREIIESAVNHAKKARQQSGKADAFIALDIGPTGKLLEPMGDLPFEKAVTLFGEVVRIGEAAGADLILIETMSDSYEAKAAVLAAKENSSLPVLVTLIFDEKGKLLTGGTAKSVVAMLEGLRVDGIGVNCGLGPKQMMPIIKDIMSECSLPVLVNPNAGLPRSENGQTIFDVTPKEFGMLMGEIADLGAHIMGGCCGTTPEHIKWMVDACKDKPFIKPIKKHKTIVSSFSQAVEIGEKPIIIGERINPTGKSKFKQALRENRIEYILEEGLKQEESGAHILDVNVGLPEIDEIAMMELVVKKLQSIIALPLQIDTSDISAMERGLRVYNGKPMINSVNGKKESMDTIFPLVRKYGGVVVGLTLDENGIPETAEERVAIAKKIYETAENYGIDKKDIIIDALAMTISSDSSSALVTLETLRRIRDELNGNTTLGVSNISFGLPQREIINANFYTMALQNGLSAAIINPNAEAMMKSYYSYLALTNQDAQCGEYIARYANQKPAEISLKEENMTLGESIEKGLRENAASLTRKAILIKKPLDIVNEELIPTLDKVGKGFEAGSIFLPQLLMSAEAAKDAFEIIKEAMKSAPQQSRGKIILATVKGDIHDIGKNIVKVLLENYGFEIYDLGKDVAPETILQTAQKEKVKLIGLSALMTTTVVSMEETIRLFHEKLPEVKIMVGGAVLTKEYAHSIGADFYGKDAMASVYYAQQIFV